MFKIQTLIRYLNVNLNIVWNEDKCCFVHLIKRIWALVPLTFACSFDDLGEDIIGNFAVLHGCLSRLYPLSSSSPQQPAGFSHLSDEGPVLWIELEMQHFDITFQYLLYMCILKRGLTIKCVSLILYTIPFKHSSTALGKGELCLSRSKSTPKATWKLSNENVFRPIQRLKSYNRTLGRLNQKYLTLAITSMVTELTKRSMFAVVLLSAISDSLFISLSAVSLKFPIRPLKYLKTAEVK